MENTEAIKRFLRVAEFGSFTRAADALGIPKASVSQAIQQLETRLETQLLHRTTRSVHLTPDGQLFYERGKDVLSELDELTSLFLTGDHSVKGVIRVDMSQPMARQIVIPYLAEFFQKYPNLNIELNSSDRQVDLITEGYDCVIRTGNLTESGLIVRKIGEMRQTNFVSPAYIAQHGVPKDLSVLAQHLLIHYHVNGSRPFDAFEYWDGQQCLRVPMRSRITVNNTDAYRAACLAGLGIMQAPLLGAQEYVLNGQLVEILKAYTAPPMPVSILYPHRRNLSKRVRIFMDWVSDLLARHL